MSLTVSEPLESILFHRDAERPKAATTLSLSDVTSSIVDAMTLPFEFVMGFVAGSPVVSACLVMVL
jgi:hypothetical protein